MATATPLEINLIRRIALGDGLRRRAADGPYREALVEYKNGERYVTSYKALNEKVNQLVRGLRAQGLRQGDRIAILGGNSSEFIYCLLACFKGGFVAVPVNFVQSPRDVEYNIEHSGAKAVFADTELQPALTSMHATHRQLLQVTLVGDSASAFMPLETLTAGRAPDEIEDIIIEDDDLAQIMYTSGTTARPKGVMLSHKNLYIATLNALISIGARKQAINHAAVLPLFHITAELFALVSLHFGAKVILCKRFEPAEFLGLIAAENINFAILLPLMWRALLACPELEKHDYASLQLAMYGMAPMDRNTLDKLQATFDCPFLTGSGQTEITGVATVLEPHGVNTKEGNIWGDGSVTCDQAVMDDAGRFLPIGEVGEIVWRSPQTMLGYYRNDEASAQAQAFGWHHSGDLGYIDEDNQFHFVDRKKDIVKSGGENISSVKVEAVLLGVPGVANVAVIGLPHPHWGEAVTAIVAREVESDLDEDTILSQCKKQLGGFEMPKRIIFQDVLPTTATGKVKKHQLREAYAELYQEL